MLGRFSSWGERVLSTGLLPTHWSLCEFLGLLQTNYLIFPSPLCLLNCWSKNWPRWCMAPPSPTCISCADLSSQMPCGMELLPAWGGPFLWCDWEACGWPCWQRAYLSALGTPLWRIGTICQSGIYFLLESLKTSLWIYNIFSLNTWRMELLSNAPTLRTHTSSQAQAVLWGNHGPIPTQCLQPKSWKCLSGGCWQSHNTLESPWQ